MNAIFENTTHIMSSMIGIPKYIIQNPKESLEATLEHFKKKKTEALVFGLVGILGATTFTHLHELNRKFAIPVGFSEITQLEKDMITRNIKLTSLNRYGLISNDLHMNIFKEWNLANGDMEQFGNRLMELMNPNNDEHHYNLIELLNEVPQIVTKVNEELTDISKIKKKISRINKHFDKAWEDIHHKETHTETNPVPYTYSCGTAENPQTCSGIKFETEEVYDWTDHNYNYYKEFGELASKELNQLLVDFSDKNIHLGTIYTASKTNDEGRQIAFQSRKRLDKKLNKEEISYQEIANTWMSGSTIYSQLPIIYSSWNQLPTHANKWKQAKKTAKSYYKKTYNELGPNPDSNEFTIVENALKNGQKLEQAIATIQTTVNNTANQTRNLKNKISKFINVATGEIEGDKKKLGYEVLRLTQQSYNDNFKNGFDVAGYRRYMLPLMGLLGAFGGALFGLGVDTLTTKFELYDKMMKK